MEICREMLLSTLCLEEWLVRRWITSSIDGMPTSTTERVAPTSPTSRHNEAMERRELVRQFLCDLLKLPSHCCQATTSNEYLERQFQSIAEVYRVFEEQQAGEVPSRQVFTEEFHRMNSLYQPKKDQCDKCSAFKVGNLSQENYDEHIVQKKDA